MPIREDDELQRRLRANPAPSSRQPYVNDFHGSAAPRVYPNVGTTLPLRRAAPAMEKRPVAAVPVRQRQPQMRAALEAADAPYVALRPVTLSGRQGREATAQLPHRRSAQPKQRRLFTIKRLLIGMAVIILAIGGWLGIKVIGNASKVFHGNLFSVLTTQKLKGEDSGRVNILVAGNSADDVGHDGADLTDSIMMVSVNVKDNTAYMLSIPRDLWVAIPGYGHAKINEAYVDGQAGKFSVVGYPKGGMGLLAEVVDQNFGLKADYYALVNYSALKDGVDAVGGVDFTVKSEDPRGLYDPSIDWTTHGPLVKLSNGQHHLNGEQALDLARARGDAPGTYGFPRADFDRTEHQRTLALALKQKILSAGTLANPIALGNLFDTVGKNVKTDFGLNEVRRLYEIGKNINNNSIQSVGLNNANGVNLLANYTSPNNESALIPAAGLDNFGKIQSYISRLQTSDPIVREGASVVVLNGTKTAGLAAQGQKILTDKQLSVAAIGDGHQVTATTIIDISNGAKPASLQLLKNTFSSKMVTNTNPYANVYTADFIVVIGPDWNPGAVSTPPAANNQ